MPALPGQRSLPLPSEDNDPCPLCASRQGHREDGTCWRCGKRVRCARDSVMGLCRVARGGCVGAARCTAAGKRNFFDEVEVGNG